MTTNSQSMGDYRPKCQAVESDSPYSTSCNEAATHKVRYPDDHDVNSTDVEFVCDIHAEMPWGIAVPLAKSTGYLIEPGSTYCTLREDRLPAIEVIIVESDGTVVWHDPNEDGEFHEKSTWEFVSFLVDGFYRQVR